MICLLLNSHSIVLPVGNFLIDVNFVDVSLSGAGYFFADLEFDGIVIGSVHCYTVTYTASKSGSCRLVVPISCDGVKSLHLKCSAGSTNSSLIRTVITEL